MAEQRKPDREQLQRFVKALFKHATPGNWVSLRAFIEDRSDLPPFKISGVKLNGNLDVVVDKACRDATFAANDRDRIVFSPPLATFTNSKHAREEDLAEGLALSTECDENAQEARVRLEQLLGPATAVVASGGEWIDPETGELKPKLHTHHRLTIPARDKTTMAKLKRARELAAKIVGGDTSNVPTVHPIRWPGSWHRKGKPTLCHIVELNPKNEIDLDAALAALQQAAAESAPNFFEGIDEITRAAVPKTPEQEVNALALINTGWFKKLFPMARPYHGNGWRVKSKDLDRPLQEDISLEPGKGIKDFGVHDLGDPRNNPGGRTAIDLVMEWGHKDFDAAFEWLAKGVGYVAAPPPPAATPLDLWAHYEPPAFPLGLLPDVIERYAVTLGQLMGCDPSGLAMGALVTCGAMIPDCVKLKVKQHSEDWDEEARLWVGLIGGVSAMKSPMMRQVIKPVRAIEKALWQTYAADMRSYEALPPDERKAATKPRLSQLRLEDTTVEAAQDSMRDNPHGMLTVQDELGGWFGSMDRYSGGKGASTRGFWLQTWTGGGYTVNRIGRGVFHIDNIGISMLGGIQPEVIRKVACENYDDGLVQRLLPIVLHPGTLGHDDPTPPVSGEYARLIDRLYKLRPELSEAPDFFLPPSILEFDAAAQVIRREVEKRNLELGKLELVNKKLGSHCGKLNGYFSRLCLIWHCIENCGEELPGCINADTARRVAKFMREFLLPHALAFYAGILNLFDDNDHLTAVAGFILARKLERVTTRDVAHGDRTMRKLTRRDTEGVLEQLDALGWVTRVPGPRPSSPPQWVVNPRCHELYAKRAEAEAARRSEVRAIMAEVTKKV
jgi:hypothetical protein